MFTDLFNCPSCKKPFDCKKSKIRTPYWSFKADGVRCRKCAPGKVNVLHGELMNFLDQPAFTKTTDGYEYTLPIENPTCQVCDNVILMIQHGQGTATVDGHLKCNMCAPLPANNNVQPGSSNMACYGCGLPEDLKRQYFCNDCNHVLCGVCCFDDHRAHDINKMKIDEEGRMQFQKCGE